MVYLDIILLGLLVWGILRGYKKGLIIQVASVAALLLGIYCSVAFSNKAIPYLQHFMEIENTYLPIISFVSTFAIVIITVHLVAKTLERFIKLVALGFLNKLLGSLFGLIKAALIISVLLLVLHQIDNRIGLLPEEAKSKSVLYGPLESIAPILIPGLRRLAQENT